MLFQYTRLPANAIRLIRFTAAATPNNIALSLEHQENYFTDRSARYVVLRCAPDEREAKPITLHGRTRLVPASLWDALSGILEYHYEAFGRSRMYVEEVCVNQRDEGERASQAVQMASIYKCAERVLVWCGPDDDSMDRAFNALRPITGESSKECGCRKGTKDTDQKHATAVGRLKNVAKAAMKDVSIAGTQTIELICGRQILETEWSTISRTGHDSDSTSQSAPVPERSPL